MPLNRITTLRSKLSLAVLNLLARAAYPNPRRGTPLSGQGDSVARILVLELWNIGDVILAMPFLTQLRGLFPRAKITFVSRPFAADLLAGTGLVDQFIPADLTWTGADPFSIASKAGEVWRLSREIRRQKFDLAFSSRLHIREHVLLAISGANRRIGFAIGKQNTSLTDAIAVGDPERHKVEDWLRLLEPFGGEAPVDVPRLFLKESERRWSTAYLTSRGVGDDDILVGIHPGASLAEKRWPLERFREVAAATAAQPGVRVLAFAEPSGYGSDLFTIPGVLGAQVGLREMMALIERCGVLVCNDSGPMHIAGALGVPTVAMFGPGIERWFAPLGEGHEILRPHEETAPFASSSRGQPIREPRQIRSAEVLAAVGRTVQRLRAGATFSRV
jgi:ADP-heptose:LPS heptosyltransferase